MKLHARHSILIAVASTALILAGCQTQTKKTVVAPPPPPPPVVENAHISLSADALFAFGKSSIDSLTDQGHEQLDQLVAKLHNAKQVQSVELLGYTDRIGSEESNLRLSQKRAEAVRDYLVAHGVDQSVIKAEGRGEADQVADCADVKGKKKLIDCLAPNRRVEVNLSVIGTP